MERKTELRWFCAGLTAFLLAWCLLLSPSAPKAEPEPVPVETVPPTQPVVEETQPPEEPLPWNLLLVNPWNTLPEGFALELTELGEGQAVDSRIFDDLQAMLDAMKEKGLSPYICSSYRTQMKQQTLYKNKVQSYLDKGYSLMEADEEAGKWVAVPSTSEHQTGLALDIVDISYPYLNEKQENTAVQKWLMANSWEYGFILRYPGEKSEITGIYYEPWHYRYVGKEAAEAIFSQDICLEEYLESLR